MQRYTYMLMYLMIVTGELAWSMDDKYNDFQWQ